jgi:D-aminopeptidase
VIDEAAGHQTGVTAILPVPWERLPAPGARAGFVSGNGFGKIVGTTQIEETGRVESPILLTGTLATFRVADHLVTALLERPEYAAAMSVNPVVAETNDGLLSDLAARPITLDHVRTVLSAASTEPLAEGCVGAGRGVRALGYKAGIGTSSRVIDTEAVGWTVGVVVQANFGGSLRIGGREVGRSLLPAEARAASEGLAGASAAPPGNSCVIVIATDAPLDSASLRRVAARGVFALGRVGAAYQSHSGDYAIAFSTSTEPTIDVEEHPVAFDALLLGALDSVEEAILNSLCTAETITGRNGWTEYAIDLDAVRALA